MPASPIYRKKRPHQGPNKNELKVSRGEAESRAKQQAGTLRERFPQVSRLEVRLRMITPADAVLEETRRVIGADEALLLDVPCLGGCGNGLFLLMEVLQKMLSSSEESHEGLGICQGVSYMDPRNICGTKLYYHIEATYS